MVKSGDGGERGGGGNERWFEKDGSGGGSTAEGQAAGLDATLAGFVVPPQKQLRLHDSKFIFLFTLVFTFLFIVLI